MNKKIPPTTKNERGAFATGMKILAKLSILIKVFAPLCACSSADINEKCRRSF